MVFSFQHFKPCLLASWFLMRNWLLILLRIPCTWQVATLLLLSGFSLYLSTVYYDVSFCGYFESILLGYCWISWICIFGYSIKFEKFCTLFLQIFSFLPPSCLSFLPSFLPPSLPFLLLLLLLLLLSLSLILCYFRDSYNAFFGQPTGTLLYFSSCFLHPQTQ